MGRRVHPSTGIAGRSAVPTPDDPQNANCYNIAAIGPTASAASIMDHDSQPPAKTRNKDEVLGNVTAKSFESAPLMMTADELAETLCISLRQVWRLKAKGDLPKPVTIGRNVRWRRSDILQWIEEGCPSSSSLLNSLIYNLVLRPIYFLRG